MPENKSVLQSAWTLGSLLSFFYRKSTTSKQTTESTTITNNINPMHNPTSLANRKGAKGSSETSSTPTPPPKPNNKTPKIYGQTRNQINISLQNIQKLRTFSNANITNQAKRAEFMAVMDKLFSGNLQKRDMLRIFEGRKIVENADFQNKVNEINRAIRSELRKSNSNFASALNSVFTNYQNNQISKSVLLLYAVLSTMNDIIRNKMANHEANGVNEETKKKIERELLYLAKRAIQLREKIFELSESA